ncbi:MAG: AAA family ATPase [Catenulispora sp.]|nr:AAA family ATPase [Catenulispora sp.]NUT40003.1 AAA family ATPase [Thermoactinospora sp.]
MSVTEQAGTPAVPASLTVLIGPAGVGKSTWCAASGLPATAIVCLDQHRADVADDECDQDATADAVALMNLRLAARLRRGLPTVVDATNTEIRVRRELLDLADEHGAAVRAVVFDAPLSLVLDRNARRRGPLPGRRWGRAVPPAVVEVHHAETAKLAADPQILLDEGFAAVDVVTTSGESVQPER